MSRRYEAVIFDAGGVLHETNDVVSADLMQELGLTPDQIRVLWEGHIQALGRGEIAEDDLWRSLAEETGSRAVRPEENLLGRAFAEALRRHDEVYYLMQELKQEGYTLAVLSDTIEPHSKALREKGLFEPFDHLFLSHEIGMRKPDPEVFEYVLQQLGIGADRAVFIDDKPGNVEAAREAGITGIVFEDSSQLRADLQKVLRADK